MGIRVFNGGEVFSSISSHTCWRAFHNTLLVLCVMAGSLSLLSGQSTTGTILGTVKDPSGKAVATVNVQIINKGTDARRSTITNDGGDFRFADVDAGSYTMIVE